MRADRLIALVLLLQRRTRVTAAEVAAELDVSVATARRDLEALSTAGVPVYPQPGRGGGWSLVGGARTDLSGLTAAESQALFLLLGPAAGVSEETRSAVRKLVRALPQTFRDDAVSAAGATLVDPVAWGAMPRSRPEVVRTLQDAVVRRRTVRLRYAGRTGPSERLVDPWGVVDKDDVWYLVAGTDRGRRTFRLDRIVAVAHTEQAATRPPDLDLARQWQEVVDEVEQRRARTWATVEIDPAHLFVLEHQFGRHVRVTGDPGAETARSGGGHRVRVDVGAPTALDIARHLAGWGEQLDVLEPEDVRSELARIGRELVGRYGAP